MERAEELMKQLLEKSDEERTVRQAYQAEVDRIDEERAGIYESAQSLPSNPAVTEYAEAVRKMKFDSMTRIQKETKLVQSFLSIFKKFGKSKTVVVYDSAKEGCDWFWSNGGSPKVTVMSGGGFGIVERKISTKISATQDLRFIAAHVDKIVKNMRALKFTKEADLLERFFAEVPTFMHGAEYSGGFAKVQSKKRLFLSRGISGELCGVLFTQYGRTKLAIRPPNGPYQLVYTTVGTDVLKDGFGYLSLLVALPEIMSVMSVVQENERLWREFNPDSLRDSFGKYLLMEAI